MISFWLRSGTEYEARHHVKWCNVGEPCFFLPLYMETGSKDRKNWAVSMLLLGIIGLFIEQILYFYNLFELSQSF